MLNFWFDATQVNPPTNWQQIEVQMNFDNDQPSASLQTTEFEFEADAAKYIHTWINTRGVFEGIPFRITDCFNLVIFDGCLDLAAEGNKIECDRVTCSVRDSRLRDYLSDRAQSFRFATLANLPANQQGAITTNDYIPVPYCINEIPNYTQLIIVSLSIYSIVRETIQVVRDIGNIVADLANPATTANAIVQAGLQLIYLSALIIALIDLIQQFIENIIQVQKHKLGMHCRTLFARACSYLGLSFNSTIFAPTSPYFNAAIIPKKVADYDQTNFINRIREYDELATPGESYGYYDGTFADFVADMENVFRAKARVIGNVLQFEREDFWNVQSGITLPAYDDYPYSLNTAELPSNYLFSWQLDTQDQNTLDEFIGTNAQMQATVTNVINRKNILLNNLVEIRPNLALARRKEVLTRVERLLDSAITLLTGFANAVTTALNAILNILPGNLQIPQLPGNLINQRVGWLRLSSDFIGVPKFVILDSANNIAANNNTLTSAEYLLNNYHFVAFPLNNQWLLPEEREIPFCCSDYTALMNANGLRTFDNRFAKAISVRWQIGTEIAFVKYRVKPNTPTFRYDNNITQTIIADKN